MSIDTRAILVAGVATGAAYALYRVVQAHARDWTSSKAAGPQQSANGGAEGAAADDDAQHAQQLQLHYASSVLPAPAADSPQPALMEVTPTIQKIRDMRVERM